MCKIQPVLIPCCLISDLESLNFTNKLDYENEIKQLNLFILTQKSIPSQNPRISETKKQIKVLIKRLVAMHDLILSTETSKMTELGDTYCNVYGNRNYTDITCFTARVEFVIRNFKNICIHFKRKKISVDISTDFINACDEILEWLFYNPVSIKIKIDLLVSSRDEIKIINLKSYLIDLLDEAINACQSVIASLKNDVGGRSYHCRERNIITKIAAIYYKGFGKMPTVYTCEHSINGYDGSLYKFILMHAPLLEYHGLMFLNKPAFVGKMAIEVVNDLLDEECKIKYL